MKKLLFVVFSILFLNGEFISSVFLEDLKTIKTVSISYEDSYQNQKRKTIQINKDFTDEVIVFSELKQNTFFKDIKLDIPSSIRSLEISYINSRNKKINKFIGISLNERDIKENNLYLYEDKKYTYSGDEAHSKPKNTTKMHKQKKIDMKIDHRLKVKTKDGGSYVDIAIQGCDNANNVCDHHLIEKMRNRIILRFNLCKKNSKKMNVSSNVKRIQIACSKRKPPYQDYPTWIVVETKKNISKYQKIETYSPRKLKYRIDFE